jgi:hypothetical protein
LWLGWLAAMQANNLADSLKQQRQSELSHLAQVAQGIAREEYDAAVRDHSPDELARKTADAIDFVQWNRIFAACGNRAQPRPGASWRVALGATVMATLAPVVILGAAILPAKAQCSPAYMASPTAIKTGAP